MSKALHFAYTSHGKSLTNTLLTYTLTWFKIVWFSFTKRQKILLDHNYRTIPSWGTASNTVICSITLQYLPKLSSKSSKISPTPFIICLNWLNGKEFLYRVNLVGLAQGLPQSNLQFTDNPLINIVMTHSTVKCPNRAYHKEQKKPLKGPYCRACSGITAMPPAVHRRPIFYPKSSLLISCLKFVSLLPISCCLCWLV